MARAEFDQECAALRNQIQDLKHKQHEDRHNKQQHSDHIQNEHIYVYHMVKDYTGTFTGENSSEDTLKVFLYKVDKNLRQSLSCQL